MNYYNSLGIYFRSVCDGVHCVYWKIGASLLMMVVVPVDIIRCDKLISLYAAPLRCSIAVCGKIKDMQIRSAAAAAAAQNRPSIEHHVLTSETQRTILADGVLIRWLVCTTSAVCYSGVN